MSLNRSFAPIINDPVSFDYILPPLNTTALSNSIPLYWINAGVQDVVELNWVFNAGIWHEQKNAVAQATAAQLKNGTASRTAQQINEALEFFGASLKVNAATIIQHLPFIHLLSIYLIYCPSFWM